MPRRPHTQKTPTRWLSAWLLAALTAAPPWFPAYAGPEGEHVVSGEASFARDGDLTVIRPSDGAIIDYRGFDILKNETVRFEQPSSQARVLNRVSGDPTKIDGSLFANGIVYLVNPAGIFFGGQAIVRVGRLVAAAGDISNHDFLSGVDRFDLSGPLENRGTLEARAVSLLGRSVANHGSIVAPDGVIALIGGQHVVLTQLEGGIDVEVDGDAPGATGVEQSGTVDAGRGSALFAVGDHYSLAINHSGVTRAREIELAGGDAGLVRVSGILDASSALPGTIGGAIRVTGDLVSLEGATLDASGAAGGGELRVGGDARGAGPLRNARRLFVDAKSVLRADALAAGDGGSVVLFSDEATGFLGRVSARGGASGGDGGFAELSSTGLLVDRGDVDLLAPAGRVGTLLYDPQDIVIVGGTLDGDDFPDLSSDVLAGDSGTLGTILFADVGNNDTPFQVYESEIEESAANIVLEARNSITASGSFDHIANGEGVGVIALDSGRNLTLRTQNKVGDDSGSSFAPGIDLTTSSHLGALEVRLAGASAINFETRGEIDDNFVPLTPDAPIKVGKLTTAGGAVSVTAVNGDIEIGSIQTSGADSASGGGNAGSINVRTFNGGGAITIGSMEARGGDTLDTSAQRNGGRGGAVTLFTQKTGDITVGAIDASGGDVDGTQESESGGAGGAVTLHAGTGLAGSDLLLQGNLDARGGSRGATTGTASRGGVVTLHATGDIEHAGQAGPHVTTSANAALNPLIQPLVHFDATNIGALSPIAVDAGEDAGRLEVVASGTGRVDVPTPGFNDILVTSNGASADVQVTQGSDVMHIANSAIVQVDTTSTHPVATIALADELEGVNDVNLQLRVPTGSVNAGGSLVLISEDDIVIGDSDGVAIVMNTTPNLSTPTETRSDRLRLLAGSEQKRDADNILIPDETGSVIDGVAGAGAGRIDLKGDADVATGLLGTSTSGFGQEGNPIVVLGGPVAVQNTRSGAVALRGEGDADFVVDRVVDPITGNTLFGVNALNGTDLSVETAGNGDLLIESFLFTDADEDDNSGVMVARVASGPGRIVLDSVPGAAVLDASGDARLEGPVTLRVDSRISAGGDVMLGSVDTDASLTTSTGTRVRSLTVSAAGLTRLTQDLGATLALRDVHFDGDVQVEGDRQLVATNRVNFLGDVFAPSADAGSLSVLSGRSVVFGGHVGEDDAGMGGRLSGLSIARNADPPFSQSLPDPFVLFTNDGEDQHVRTGAGGLRFSPSGRLTIPVAASVGKNEGNLLLESVGGTIDFGPFEKLTVGGNVELRGDTVTIGDVSALELHVFSDTGSVRTRPPAQVLMPNGGFVKDGGTDLIANVVAFSNPAGPAVLGSDPAPRIAAVSVSNTGSLGVLGLAGNISRNNLVVDGIPLDLAILPLDSGNETPQQPPPVTGLFELHPSREAAAGSALAPGAEETLAYLRCAADDRADCGVLPASPLDSPRGRELAQRAGLLLGDSPEARDDRARLAQLDPSALRELAIFMTELRLLGLSEGEYTAARDSLYQQILAGAAAGAPDTGALAAAVRREGRGVPL